MNYLIFKGEDSREIKGLVISELPPISKPQMRTVETVVDGVDGSLIEEVGYSSYDKSVIIGLTHNADIDEVIAYFSGSGDVVFSNEPDKYYKASIVNQIDFARLVRYKTATVTFRVQPFKHEYLESATKVDAKSLSGTTITINNENGSITQLIIEGESVQDGTPTPDAPVEIESIGAYNEEADKYEIEVKETGKNKLVLIDGVYTSNGITATVKDGIVTLSGTSTATSFVSIKAKNNIEENKTYILSINNINTVGGTNDVRITDEGGEIVARTYFNNKTNSSVVFTYSSAIELNYIVIRTEANVTYNNFVIKPQIEEGTTATVWQVGKVNTSLIVLDEPLRSLPNGIKDNLYIRGNKVIVERKVGGVVLNGSEYWQSSANYFYINSTALAREQRSNGIGVCSHFAYATSNMTAGKFKLGGNYAFLMYTSFANVTEWKEWLRNNNITINYELAEVYTEEIGDITPIVLNEGQNTLTNSENVDMVLSYIDESVNVFNLGNHTAKPVITLKGYGTVELIVNNERLLRYNFPVGEDTVVIDSEKQDAYLGTILKNRNMLGEFPVLKKGENTITWEGAVAGIEITNKSRWL